LLILGSLILVVAILFFAQKVILPLVLALLFAFILSPAVMRLQHRGLRRVPAVVVVVLVAALLLGSIGLAVGRQLDNLANELPERKDQIATKISNLLAAGKGTTFDRLTQMIGEITQTVRRKDGLVDSQAREPIPVQIYTSGYSQLLSALQPALELVATTGLVIVLLIFILISREDLRNRLVRLIGRGQVTVTTRAMDEAGQRISRYLLTQLFINTSFGVALGVGLSLIGVPFALFWGFLGALLRFVPYVGVWIAAVLISGYSIAIFDGWTRSLLVLALFAVIELITVNILEPLLFGHSTGVSPVALLVSAVFWTWLWGPVGLLLSTPLTACLAVLGKYVPQLAFLNILLGSEPVLDAEVNFYQRLLARDHDEAAELVEAFLQDHTPEQVYDEVLIPTLVLAKRDRERGALIPGDEEFILQTTRAVANDLVSPQQLGKAEENSVTTLPSEDQRQKVVILACPARDAEDELALIMFQQLLGNVPCQVETLSAQTLSGELVSRVAEARPDLVLIATLPPGGSTLTRYLCKRLRSHFADLKIHVGCWGLDENVDRLRERLASSGADSVAASLLESRNQIVPLIQVFTHVKAQPAA
jgi:predicted PurR-regulated permease PerM